MVTNQYAAWIRLHAPLGQPSQTFSSSTSVLHNSSVWLERQTPPRSKDEITCLCPEDAFGFRTLRTTPCPSAPPRPWRRARHGAKAVLMAFCRKSSLRILLQFTYTNCSRSREKMAARESRVEARAGSAKLWERRHWDWEKGRRLNCRVAGGMQYQQAAVFIPSPV